MITVNAMGDQCPIPVVKTKNAIKEMKKSDVVEVLVDNEIAVQNLTKMANQKGYEVTSEKKAEGAFRVEMKVEITDMAEETVAEPVACIPDARKNTVVVISSNVMGGGDDKLGVNLLKAFIFAVTQQDELPSTMLFYNGGAKMTVNDSPALEDLKSLEAQGVEILTCGTCLNFYGLTDELAVGGVTNMYEIVERMNNASLIVKP